MDLPNCSGGPVNMAKGVNDCRHAVQAPPPPAPAAPATPFDVVASLQVDTTRTKGLAHQPRFAEGQMCMGQLQGPDGFIALQPCNRSRHQTFAINVAQPNAPGSPVVNWIALAHICVHPSADGLSRTDLSCKPENAAAVQRLSVFVSADKYQARPDLRGHPLTPYVAYVDRARSTCMGFTEPVVGRRLRMLPCDVNNPAAQFLWRAGQAYDIVR